MFGVFSLNKKDIMKYKKLRYEKLLNQMNLGPNMEVAHYMERSWGVICYPLIYTKTSLIYYNKNYNKTNDTFHTRNQDLRPGQLKLNMTRNRQRIMNHVGMTNQMIKRNVRNIRNPRFQNYLRSLLLRRNMMRKRRNLAGLNRRNRNIFRF